MTLHTSNNVRLLLDENISPNISARLWNEGIDAIPLRDRGMLRSTDIQVLSFAQTEARAVATIDEHDFERLVSKMANHCGIAVIPSGASRDEQFDYILSIARFWMATQNAMAAAHNRITAVDERMNVTSRFAHKIEQPTVGVVQLKPRA